MVPYHFGIGMEIRNTVREVLRDERLPGVEYPGGQVARNWDDFYVAAFEEAAGIPGPEGQPATRVV